MSGDALKKVLPGQPLGIPAAAYNSFVDAALELQRHRMNQGAATAAGRPRHPGALLVRNDTGVDLDRLGIVTLGPVVIAPADNPEEFLAGPIFAGASPVAGGNAAILLEPILSGRFGWAVVHGLVPAKVDMRDGEHRRCRVADGDTARLQSGETGPIRILWVAGAAGEQWAVVHLRDADERAAVTVDDSPMFLEDAFADTGTMGGGDLTVRRQTVAVSGANKLRLFVPVGDLPEPDVCAMLKSLPGYASDKILFPVIVRGTCRLVEMSGSSCDCFCCVEDPDASPANFSLFRGPFAYDSAAAICAALGPGTYSKVSLNGVTYWFQSLTHVGIEWNGDTLGNCVWLPEGGNPGSDMWVRGQDSETGCLREMIVRLEWSDMSVEDEVCP